MRAEDSLVRQILLRRWSFDKVTRLLAFVALGFFSGPTLVSAAEVTAPPKRQFVKLPLREPGEYWTFTGCPDDDRKYRVLRDFVKNAELLDVAPEGATSVKQRFDDKGTVRVFIIMPESGDGASAGVGAIAAYRGLLENMAATCSDDYVRCAILLHTAQKREPGSSKSTLLGGGLAGIPQFIAHKDFLRDAGGGTVDEGWPVAAAAQPMAAIFNRRLHLRWLIKLSDDLIASDRVSTLVLAESRRSAMVNDCNKTEADSKKKVPEKKPALPPPPKQDKKPIESDKQKSEPPPEPDSGVRLANLKGLAFSLAERNQVSLGAEWLQKLNKDRPILVYVWGTWCIPCRADWEPLQKLHKAYGTRVYFLGVAFEDFDDGVFRKVESYLSDVAKPKAPFVTARNTYVVPTPNKERPKNVLDRLDQSAGSPPFFAVFDRTGRVVFKLNRGIDEDASRAALECALQAAARPQDAKKALCRCMSSHSSDPVTTAWTINCDASRK